MPIYEYECEKCGSIVEKFQTFSDKPLKKCEHCSGKLHKIISQSTFHLKGTGWYVTDYAGKTQGATSAPSDSEAPSTPSESSKDSKASTNEKKAKAEK